MFVNGGGCFAPQISATSPLHHFTTENAEGNTPRVAMFEATLPVRGACMVDRSIKMDERTDALVTDLAYFLRSSKKLILHDAVAEFAETHHPRLLGRPGSVRKIGATDGELTHVRGPSEDGEFGLAASGGIAGGDRLESARDRGETFEVLDPLERLAVRRRELLRRFAETGGTNVRVLEEADEPVASAEASSRIVLLAETDPVDGSAAVPALEEVARGVLGVHVTVVSLTALRLFGSDRLEQALEHSRPL
jgi:hypothetical protein